MGGIVRAYERSTGTVSNVRHQSRYEIRAENNPFSWLRRLSSNYFTTIRCCESDDHHLYLYSAEVTRVLHSI